VAITFGLSQIGREAPFQCEGRNVALWEIKGITPGAIATAAVIVGDISADVITQQFH